MSNTTVTYEQALQAALPTYVKYRMLSDSREYYGEMKIKKQEEARRELINELYENVCMLSRFIDRLFGVEDTREKLEELYRKC